MRRLLGFAIVTGVLALASAGSYRAATATPGTPEAVARAVAKDLRCPTCQGLSIADSPAPMAAGMRKIVEERAASGQSPEQIRDYFVARYSEWILLSPPRRGISLLVWVLPGAALLTGGLLALAMARRGRVENRSTAADEALAGAVFAAYAAGHYRPPESRPGERIEAVLELLASIDEDAAPDSARARQAALGSLADALADEEEAARAGVAETPGRRGARTAGAPRAAMYAGAVTVAAAAVVALLALNLNSRGPGGLPTGVFGQGLPTPSPSAGPSAESLRALTEARPLDPGAWLELGRALDRNGRLGAAYQAYQRALSLDPSSVQARQLAAWVLIRGDRPEEALPLLEPALRKDPGDAQNVLLLGLAEYGAKRPGAMPTLRRYLQLAPDGPMSEQVRQLLAAQEQR